MIIYLLGVLEIDLTVNVLRGNVDMDGIWHSTGSYESLHVLQWRAVYIRRQLIFEAYYFDGVDLHLTQFPNTEHESPPFSKDPE